MKTRWIVPIGLKDRIEVVIVSNTSGGMGVRMDPMPMSSFHELTTDEAGELSNALIEAVVNIHSVVPPEGTNVP